LLAEFYAPLVKGIEIPNNTLYKYLVFVKCDQSAQCEWVKCLKEQGISITGILGMLLAVLGVFFVVRK
jgi:hypothetical protein